MCLLFIPQQQINSDRKHYHPANNKPQLSQLLRILNYFPGHFALFFLFPEKKFLLHLSSTTATQTTHSGLWPRG